MDLLCKHFLRDLPFCLAVFVLVLEQDLVSLKCDSQITFRMPGMADETDSLYQSHYRSR